MTFEAKLRKIGNSWGIVIPLRVITEANWSPGEVITLSTNQKEVITKEIPEVITSQPRVITPIKLPERNGFDARFCKKHPGAMMGSCGCK